MIRESKNRKNNKNNKTSISRNYNSLIPHKNIYMAEFKTRLDEEELRFKKEMENKLEKQISFSNRYHILRNIQSQKQNNLSFQLGYHFTINDVIKSPYLSLRDKILTYTIFSMKQRYIIEFIEKYTRPFISSETGNEKENHYWFYCIESNTPLVPTFYYQLAKAYENGEYLNKLLEICKNRGCLDRDNYYFDVYSGYPITSFSNINNKRNDYFDKEKKQDVINNITIISHSNIKIVNKILDVIINKMDITTRIRNVREFIINYIIKMIDTMIEKEDIYQDKLQYLNKKNQSYKSLSYEDFKHLNIIYLVTVILFISIQTMIPSMNYNQLVNNIKSKNKRSFTGYPMKSIKKDYSGIEYISLVVTDLKSTVKPWNSLLHTSKTLFENNLIKKIDLFLQHNDIKILYTKKELYDDRLNQRPTTNNIQKWIYMLPPIIDYTILTDLTNVTNDLHNDFIKVITNGTKHQRQYIGIYQCKLMQYSYGMIEIIHMLSKDTKERGKESSILQHFINESESLLSYIELSKKYSIVLHNIKELNIPSMLTYIETNDKFVIKGSNQRKEEELITMIPMTNTSKFSNKNVYRSFIHYLQLDECGPIPYHLQELFPEKPKLYDKCLTLDEKIEILQKDKNVYNDHSFHRLLKLIHCHSNILNNQEKKNDFDQYIRIQVKKDGSNDFYDKMIILLQNTNMEKEEKKMNIIELNNEMFLEINTMVDNFLCSKDMLYWKENILSMTNWNKKEISSMKNQIRNAIYNMVNIYPSIIINQIDKKGNQLGDLCCKKETRDLFVDMDRSKMQRILSFVDIIPMVNDIYSESIVEGLYSFCWVFVFSSFLQCSTEDNRKNIIHILSIFLQIETENRIMMDV